MMTGHWLTGSLILITGVALLVFLFAKLIPRTNQARDVDTKVLLGIFILIGVGLIGMGGFIGMGSWSSALGCIW